MPQRREVIYDALMAMRGLSDAMDRVHSTVEGDMDMNVTDLRALRMLIDAERSGRMISPHDVAAHLRISTASTSKLIDRLERAGHVERRPHPSDRRARVLWLTDFSRASFFDKFGVHLRTMSSVAGHFTDAELAVISRFMDQMSAALDPR